LLVAPWHANISALADQSVNDNRIGIRLLDAPVSRRDDPRAQVYIVDHLAPGTIIKRRVSIMNSSTVTRHIDVFPGAASIDNNAFDPIAGRATNELTSWISVDKGSFDIPAGASTDVQATVAVPPTASSGERYAVVWAETSTPPNAPGEVTMTSRVGVRVYLDIGPGGEPPSDFEVTKLTPARTADGRPEVLAAVHNTGGRALDMAGELSLSDGPGSLRAGPFPVTLGTTLLPGHTGSVQVLLDRRLPDGPWQVGLTLRSGVLERVVTATITFPAAAGTTGVSVTPDTWIGTHLFLLIGLAALLLAAVVGSTVVIRRRRSRQTV
jgi:hypothetical protein